MKELIWGILGAYIATMLAMHAISRGSVAVEPYSHEWLMHLVYIALAAFMSPIFWKASVAIALVLIVSSFIQK